MDGSSKQGTNFLRYFSGSIGRCIQKAPQGAGTNKGFSIGGAFNLVPALAFYTVGRMNPGTNQYCFPLESRRLVIDLVPQYKPHIPSPLRFSGVRYPMSFGGLQAPF